MASGDNGAFFRKYSERQVGATPVNYLSDTIKFALGRASALSVGKTITGATNATPIVITSTAHGFTTGDWVAIWNVGGNTNANGIFRVGTTAANTFELLDPITGASIAGSGAYTSGGIALSLDAFTFLADLTGSWNVAQTAALSSKTATLGILDAADTLFAAVASGAPCDFLIKYKDTGVSSTSPIIMIVIKGTGIPVTPNGADINLVFDNGTFKIGMP